MDTWKKGYARARALTLLILTLLVVPMVNAVTIDGPTNFQGPGGGNVVFQDQMVVNQINQINNFYRFTRTVYDGVGTGNLGFDCDTGDNMTITDVTPTSLTYTITGAGQQRIYFQGYGLPDEITGGTVVTAAGGNLVVTTTGAGTVTMSWYSNVDNIINQMTGYLIVVALVPLTLGAALIIYMAQGGEFDKNMFMLILSGAIMMLIVLLAWGAIIKSY